MATANEPVSAGKTPRTVAQDLHELGSMAREMVEEKVEQVRSSAGDHAREGREKVEHVERSIEQYIRAQPLKSVLMAAGAGLLIGRFWLRR